MQRIGTRHPNAVHARIARTERTEIGHVAIKQAGADLLDGQFHVVFEHVDAHETETGVTDLAHAQPRQLDGIVAHGVIVRRAVLLGNVAHGLAGGFAQTDAHFDRFGGSADAGHELQSAVDFTAEVEQDRGAFALFAREDGLGCIGRRGLTVALQEQVFGTGNQVAVLGPYHADGRDIGAGPGIELRLVGHVLREYGRQRALAHRLGRKRRGVHRQCTDQQFFHFVRFTFG